MGWWEAPPPACPTPGRAGRVTQCRPVSQGAGPCVAAPRPVVRAPSHPPRPPPPTTTIPTARCPRRRHPPTSGCPSDCPRLGRPIVPLLLAQLQKAGADLLLDAGSSQPLGLRPLRAPAVQLQVRGQGQGAHAGLGLQGRQQEVAVLHGGRRTGLGPPGLGRCRCLQPAVFTVSAAAPSPKSPPGRPHPQPPGDSCPPCPELGGRRGHLGQVGGRGRGLLKVEFGQMNWPCLAQVLAWLRLLPAARTGQRGPGPVSAPSLQRPRRLRGMGAAGQGRVGVVG